MAGKTAEDFEEYLPPAAIEDACKLLGVGEFENSAYRGNPDFATALERKWPLSVWKRACKRAMGYCKTLQQAYFKQLDEREAVGLPRYPADPDDPMQLEIDFGRKKTRQEDW
jgi:hypothetical protein